jgi:hypothetical protein
MHSTTAVAQSRLRNSPGTSIAQPVCSVVFAIRTVEGNEKSNGCAPGGIQVWRVMGNVPEPVKRLTRAEPAGCARWISSFHISHRITRGCGRTAFTLSAMRLMFTHR